jgi:tetratricopeptide (TPR) repeat protein
MMAHQGWAQVLRAQRRWEEAILEYEKVIEINRNFPYAYTQLARCKLVVRGALDEAASLAQHAIRLSPRDPGIYAWYARLGEVETMRSRTGQAVGWYEKARHANPGHPGGHAGLAAAYGLAGEYARAAAALAGARKLSDVYSSLARVRTYSSAADPQSKIRDLFEATYLAGLCKAGCRRNELTASDPVKSIDTV